MGGKPNKGTPKDKRLKKNKTKTGTKKAPVLSNNLSRIMFNQRGNK